MRPIAKQREIDADLVGEGGSGKWSVDTDAQNLSIGLLDLGFEIAEERKLVRSAAGKCQWVEGKNKRLAIQSILEGHGVTAAVGQFEFRRFVTDLNGHRRSPTYLMGSVRLMRRPVHLSRRRILVLGHRREFRM